jgi:alkanesulfonate monooxygenase SsuD/methylene tetrahydromethanopterin reductase-like flavin-dependent oxidoreductase (luciferase family)
MTRYGFVWTSGPDFITRAEALGVDSLWVGGHVAFRNPTQEPLVRLARLAAFATRASIGTSILILPLYAPTLLAKQLADIVHSAAVPVVLGVGVGGDYPPEFQACGVPMAGRGERADEAIEVMRRLWTGDPVDHAGPLFAMSGVRIAPALPPGRLPVIVAGRRAPAIQRAARLGEGWMPYLYSPRRYAESAREIRDRAEQAGRDLTGFAWMNFCFVHVDDDGAAARAMATRILSRRYGQDMGPQLDRVAVVGTPNEVAARLAEFADAGVEHVIFAALAMERDRQTMEQLMTEVIPQLRPRSTGR